MDKDIITRQKEIVSPKIAIDSVYRTCYNRGVGIETYPMRSEIELAYTNNVVKIKGLAYWSKVLGQPQPGYDPDIKSWSIDVAPDGPGLSKLQQLGMKIKDDEKGSHDGNRFVNFRRLEFKRGTEKANNPITVEDAEGNEWDRKVLIGNGSHVEVDFNTYDIPAKGRLPAGRGMAILSIKVLDLVTYDKDQSSSAEDKPSKRNTVSSSEESWSGEATTWAGDVA